MGFFRNLKTRTKWQRGRKKIKKLRRQGTGVIKNFDSKKDAFERLASESFRNKDVSTARKAIARGKELLRALRAFKRKALEDETVQRQKFAEKEIQSIVVGIQKARRVIENY